MKTIVKKIDNLIEIMEMGLLNKEQSISEIIKLRNEVSDKFQESSDEFIICINLLIDAQELTKEFN